MKDNKKNTHGPIRIHRQLRTKLIASFMIPVICIIILGVVSYQQASTAIISNYEDSVQETMNMTNQYISLVIDTVRSNYKSYLSDSDMSSYFKGLLGSTMAKTFALSRSKEINRDINTNSLVSGLYFIADDGISITTGAPTTSELFTAYAQTPEGVEVADDRANYHLFGNLSDADEALGTDSNNYALRIAKYMNNSKSVMLVDLDKKTIMNSLAALEVGEGSLVALITHDGTELYSDGQSLHNSTLTSSDFYQSIVGTEESGMKYVTYNGESYLFLYSPMYASNPVQSMMICALIPQSTILAQVATIRIVAIALVVIAVIIAALLGCLLSAHINGNIYYILRQLQKISEGDLTIQLKSKSKDEFKLLALGVNSMTDSMKTLITNVTDASNSLNLAAEQVSTSSDTFVTAAEDIQSAISEIESGVAQLDINSADCLTQMDSLSDKINDVTGDTKDVITLTQSAGTSINQGISSMSVLTDSAKKTSEITNNVITAIETLSEKSRSIEQIVESINSIATETNLLSLNASIEAARAGESGRGFAVVAEQIRQLADQSAMSAGQIQKIIDDIVVTTHDAVEIAKEAETTVEFQEKAVAQTTDSFVTMDKQIHSLLDSISVISDNIGNMEHARSTTQHAIEDISDISAKTSAGSSNVNRTVAAQRDAIETLDAAANTLQDRAAELTELLRQFKI